ncbi:MAG: hypothetical protein OET79_13855, partial [Nitrospirota bacterium]|nr:hypothetical protein [Nitrospirota bacterium]
MGTPFLATVTQWSRGEYPDANNLEDDLQIIAGLTNGLGFRSDDLASLGSVNGDGTPVSGVIEKTEDTDLFALNSAAGPISLSAVNATNPNLDLQIRLLAESGEVVAQSSPANDLHASLQTTVSGGTYHVEVSGVGNGDLQSGYSNYGSLGSYTLVANTPQGVPVVVDILSPGDSSISLPAGTG